MSIREKARRAWRAAKWVAWTALFLALATVAVATLFAVPQETGSASEFVWALVVSKAVAAVAAWLAWRVAIAAPIKD